MKQRKQWVILTFILILSLIATACGGAQETGEPTEALPGTGQTEVPEATEPLPETGETEVAEPTEAATEAATAAATEAPEATEAATEAATAEATEGAEGTEAATEEVVIPTAASGDIDCMGAQEGDEVTMFYQWSGVEEEQLMAILQPLVDTCGITLAPESSRDQALLDTRVQAGTPPDIAFFNVTQLQQYSDLLVPVTELGVTGDNIPQFWRDLGTVNGDWLGIPVKADVKSIIWYSPINFDAFGYEIPTTWEELDALVEQMVADGNVPWSMGLENEAATGWTGSDFIQDILLVQQGPEYVMSIISGETPYNDAGVVEAYETYGRWASDPTYTVGGAQGTLTTAFRDAIFDIVVDPPEAMMVKQSGFAGNEIAAEYPDLEYGTDYDFFQVPDLQGLQGGSDWMMAFSDEPAVQAIFAYLSSELGGQNWANVGFGLTPNTAGLPLYDPDTDLGKLAQILTEAEAFTPDIGDSIPGGFNNAEWTAIINYLNGADLQAELDQASAVQQDALGETQ
jgi:alpha-glucoside transport system substrate-binding protein